MKSGGKKSSNLSFLSNGKCLSANEADPASIQLSKTSGTLDANLSHFGHFVFISSISGL